MPSGPPPGPGPWWGTHRAAIVLLALAAVSSPALAHSPIEGIGKFYGGLLHPLLVPSHALALLVFALLVGQNGVRAMRLAYPPFLGCLAVGLVAAGFSLVPGIDSQSVLLGTGAACGLLVALHRAPPRWLLPALGTLLGLVIGLDSGVDGEGYSRQEAFAALLGCWIGAAIGLIVIAGVTEMLRRPWQRVAVRVLGSWGTASAVLVLALALR